MNHEMHKSGESPAPRAHGIAFVYFVCFVVSCHAPVFAAVDKVAIKYSPTVEQHALQEITFQLQAGSRNPYDPREIAVDAVFVNPLDRELKVPAFFYKAYDPVLNQPRSGSGRKVRFTPREMGRYSFKVLLSPGGKDPEVVAEGTFRCVYSQRPGFVARQGRGFSLTTGQHFFPLGVNRCWGDLRWPAGYLKDMDAVAASGANFLRVWLSPWWLPIEPQPGRYDQGTCARLDAVFQHAEALGLRTMLCIEQHGNLQPEGAEIGLWQAHPYNTANGGPCQTRMSFFSHPAARRLFKNRLRYLVARWGYSRALLAWELFNEVEWVVFEHGGLAQNFRRVADWHRDMSRFLRTTDCFGHLVTTSSDIPLQRTLIAEGTLDFVNLHLYEDVSLFERMEAFVSWMAQDLSVPVLVGEFGPRMKQAEPRWVTRGIFTTAFVGTGSAALPWLQDVETPSPYYRRIAAAVRYFSGIDWPKENFRLVEPEALESVMLKADDLPDAAEYDYGVKVFLLRGDHRTLVFAFVNEPIRSQVAVWRPRRTLKVRLAMPVQGAYSVESWDLEHGAVIRRDAFKTQAGELTVVTPAFRHEIALKIWRHAPGK